MEFLLYLSPASQEIYQMISRKVMVVENTPICRKHDIFGFFDSKKNIMTFCTSKIKLSGETTREEINLSGAGSLEAFELESSDCEVSISGIGGAEVDVKDRLVAKISGMGGIQYRGSPNEIRREVSGIGKIKESR